ncbi:MAG: glycosyltransferase family 4 protein [Halobacteriota archaeon]|nr:glycosyltransferase family 4 protein [Halobacteriota archaeon]
MGSRENIPEKKGAIERLTFELASNLVKRGDKVTIFTVGKGGRDYISKEGIQIYELCKPILIPPSYIYPMLVFSKKARKKYEELKSEGERFDAIHSVYYPNLLGFGRTEEPIVVTEYNHYPWKKEFEFIPNLSFTHRMRWELDCVIRKLEAAFLLRRAKKVICVSETLKEWIINQIPIQNEKLEVIYNFVDTDQFHPCFDDDLRRKLAPNDEKIILFVGRKTPHKGLHNLIKMLPKIKHSKLVAVGPISTRSAEKEGEPYINYLYKLIEEEKLEDRVIFTGFVPTDVLPKYYSTADVLALPSLAEAFGLVIVEAMACKTPVVAYDVKPIYEIISNEKDGLMIPPENPSKFRDAISFLLENEDIRLEMGIKAREKLLKKFSLEASVNDYICLYKKILSGED